MPVAEWGVWLVPALLGPTHAGHVLPSATATDSAPDGDLSVTGVPEEGRRWCGAERPAHPTGPRTAEEPTSPCQPWTVGLPSYSDTLACPDYLGHLSSREQSGNYPPPSRSQARCSALTPSVSDPCPLAGCTDLESRYRIMSVLTCWPRGARGRGGRGRGVSRKGRFLCAACSQGPLSAKEGEMALGWLLVSLATGLPLGPGACFEGLSQHLRLQAEVASRRPRPGGAPSGGSRLSPGPVRDAELPRADGCGESRSGVRGHGTSACLVSPNSRDRNFCCSAPLPSLALKRSCPASSSGNEPRAAPRHTRGSCHRRLCPCPPPPDPTRSSQFPARGQLPRSLEMRLGNPL